ncbi:hypothetical protein AQAU111925_13205 [Aquirufa aurantiipilula]
MASPGNISPESVPVAPEAEVKTKAPVPELPVKVNLLVKFETPFTKSEAEFNLSPPDNPEITTPTAGTPVTVMMSWEASKVVTVFP